MMSARFWVAGFLMISALWAFSPAFASIEVYDFSGESERVRYAQFLEELRCPKCKNNNLAGTNSKIAVDLRRQLHAMIEEGKTDEEIIDYMVIRYGDFVLYRPRFQAKTVALWFGPIILVGLGLLVVGGIVVSRRRQLAQPKKELSEEEAAALARLLDAKQKSTGAK